MSLKENNELFGFFGELNPLSNFHPASFVYNNTKYHSTEQLFQHQKAKLFGDKEISIKILDAEDPLTCKHLSKDITNYNHEVWTKEAKLHCKEGIKAKFWGNGILLHDENSLNPSKWHQQGLLGEILVDIRLNINDIMGYEQQISQILCRMPSSGSNGYKHYANLKPVFWAETKYYLFIVPCCDKIKQTICISLKGLNKVRLLLVVDPSCVGLKRNLIFGLTGTNTLPSNLVW